jgi:hypothetical protein
MTGSRLVHCAAVAAVVVSTRSPARGGTDPFADAVTSHAGGANPAPGYGDPATVLGAPERFTGEDVFPQVVSTFNPPWGTGEIFSIGAGGHVAVSFDEPVADDPRNPFGIDLLIFGNAGLLDSAYPDGICGGLFADEGGVVEVSADGIAWVTVPGAIVDTMFPSDGWLDAEPYAAAPGAVASRFTRPVDPALGILDFLGLDTTGVRTLYDGSGGGTGIDLAATGLPAICCVRISNPGSPRTTAAMEIDAFADVTPSADVDADGTVGIVDFLALLKSWGACPGAPDPCAADVDRDASVGVTDFLAVLEEWDR